ncbi:hypothetical protein ACHAXT_005567 [Thalassiosira profunda]
MSVIQELLKPGGAIALIPAIRVTILLLLVMVIIMGILDIARIHMVVLSCLSVGLLGSISYFEKVWADVQQSRGSQSAAAKVDKEAEKTD